MDVVYEKISTEAIEIGYEVQQALMQGKVKYFTMTRKEFAALKEALHYYGAYALYKDFEYVTENVMKMTTPTIAGVPIYITNGGE